MSIEPFWSDKYERTLYRVKLPGNKRVFFNIDQLAALEAEIHLALEGANNGNPNVL